MSDAPQSLIRHGRLVLVGTPIGNLDDLTPRAAKALKECSVLVCEDTRRAAKLLQHVGAGKPRLIVANEHTEFDAKDRVLETLAAGETVLVTSDAGMPAVSDPGWKLVRAAIEAGFTVDAAPGPTAMTMALVLSGMPTERFVFEGFLPRSGKERTQRLGAVAQEQRTIVLYEAPHRVLRTLQDLESVCGSDRQVCTARELTKRYQNIQRGTLASIRSHFTGIEPKGEFVVVLAGAEAEEGASTDDQLLDRLRAELASGSSKRDAVAAVTVLTGEPKRRIYDLALTL